jgi:hypothetical protein
MNSRINMQRWIWLIFPEYSPEVGSICKLNYAYSFALIDFQTPGNDLFDLMRKLWFKFAFWNGNGEILLELILCSACRIGSFSM